MQRAPVTCFAVHPSGKIGLSVSLDKTLRLGCGKDEEGVQGGGRRVGRRR